MSILKTIKFIWKLFQVLWEVYKCTEKIDL